MRDTDIELSTRLLSGPSSSEDNMDDHMDYKKDEPETTVARQSSWTDERTPTLVVKGVDPVYEAKAQVLNNAVGHPHGNK